MVQKHLVFFANSKLLSVWTEFDGVHFAGEVESMYDRLALGVAEKAFALFVH